MSEIIELAVTNGIPTTTSLAVAERFGKRHADVLRSIEGLDCSNEFTERNFAFSAYKDSTGRALPMHHITKDGFMFLAMGFNGKEAAAWKERYIAAFNAMEAELLRVASQQLPKADGQLYLSHRADIMVAADRTFRAVMRSSRSAGLKMPAALRRATAVALEKTGVNMLDELQAHSHLVDMESNWKSKPGKNEAAVLPSVEEFWRDWFGGVLGLPYATCRVGQVFRAYKHWCMERDHRVLEPNYFSKQLNLIAEEQGQRLMRHTVRLFTPGDTEASRLYIVGRLPNGAIGAWATEQVRIFEAHLLAYCGTTV